MSEVFRSVMSTSILQDHAMHPRYRREVLDVFDVGHAANPMCADVFDVGVAVEDGFIVEAAFTGQGCALAVGGASLLCEWLRGKRVKDVKDVVEELPHLGGEVVGRMREGCVRVSVVAVGRVLLRILSDFEK
jgi:nitrogen fixation protein NifU and related proteins